MHFCKTLIKHFNFHISFKWRLNVHACIMEINQSPLSLQPPLQKSYNEISVIQTIPFMHSCACKFLLHLITLQILYSDVHSHACMFLWGGGYMWAFPLTQVCMEPQRSNFISVN